MHIFLTDIVLFCRSCFVPIYLSQHKAPLFSSMFMSYRCLYIAQLHTQYQNQLFMINRFLLLPATA